MGVGLCRGLLMRTGTRCPRCQPAWEGGSQATSALALVFCKLIPSRTSSLATANAKLCKFSIKPRFNLFIFNALLGALIPVFLGAPRCFLRLDVELNPPPQLLQVLVLAARCVHEEETRSRAGSCRIWGLQSVTNGLSGCPLLHGLCVYGDRENGTWDSFFPRRRLFP